jgi:hypothetical protein
MHESEIRSRLDEAGRAYLQGRSIQVPLTYWRELERRLIAPAAQNLSRAGPTDQLLAGSTKKLEFLLGEVIEQTRTYIRERGPTLDDEHSAETADAVVSTVVATLRPLWPFCD